MKEDTILPLSRTQGQLSNLRASAMYGEFGADHSVGEGDERRKAVSGRRASAHGSMGSGSI
jgi:hypothetical protein